MSTDTQPSAEAVNHPRHYNTHPSGVECIDLVEWLGFNRGNAIKYLWRKDDKGKTDEDAQKALWYTGREVQRMKTYRLMWSFNDPALPKEILDECEKWKAYEPEGWRRDVVALLWDGHISHLTKALDILAFEVAPTATLAI